MSAKIARCTTILQFTIFKDIRNRVTFMSRQMHEWERQSEYFFFSLFQNLGVQMQWLIVFSCWLCYLHVVWHVVVPMHIVHASQSRFSNEFVVKEGFHAIEILIE